MITLSPHHSMNEFPDELTIDQKIEVFIDRIESWQLSIAKRLIDANIPHREVALLYIVMSYFEMIGKYVEDIDNPTDAFNAGVKTVFPEIDEWDKGSTKVSDRFLKFLCGKVRNGLYHVGMPNPS